MRALFIALSSKGYLDWDRGAQPGFQEIIALFNSAETTVPMMIDLIKKATRTSGIPGRSDAWDFGIEIFTGHDTQDYYYLSLMITSDSVRIVGFASTTRQPSRTGFPQLYHYFFGATR